MTRSDAIADLCAALARAQGEMGHAMKTASNPHFRSKYADLASVWDAVRAPLARHGLSVVQLPYDAPDGRVGLETVLMHSSGQYIEARASVPLAKSDAQSLGSALSYLRRYSLCAVLGVASEDDDGHAATRGTRREPGGPPRVSPHYAPDDSYPDDAPTDDPPTDDSTPFGGLVERLAEIAGLPLERYGDICRARELLGSKAQASQLTRDIQAAVTARSVSPAEHAEISKRWQRQHRQLEKAEKSAKADVIDSFRDPPGRQPGED